MPSMPSPHYPHAQSVLALSTCDYLKNIKHQLRRQLSLCCPFLSWFSFLVALESLEYIL
eukprot:m.299188 g.299188  ORF g.299188 m.299188 type:complete len:59 (-) comp14056_c0_seq1:13-189(-)